jgi:ankyrin repeat protein
MPLKWLSISVFFFSISFLQAMEIDLLLAARDNCGNRLKKILKHNNVNVNKADNRDGQTPLLALCFRPDGVVSYARRLIAMGADINHQNKYGATALIIATYYGNKEMVGYLLEVGALDLQNNEGKNASYFARLLSDREIFQLITKKFHTQKIP